jgi:DHA1 family multidrug resistance protein-like MFS transporter
MGNGEEQGWIRTVAIMWLAVLIAIIGMSLVIPFLPLYLQELGVPNREVKLWAGWVGGINFLFAAIFAPLWGHLADRYGRKPMALRALAGLAVSVGLMANAQNAWQLFGLRMLQGTFGGFVAEAIALVATGTPKPRVGSAIGFLQTAVVGGNLIGPLIGGELSHHFGYRATFRITGGALIAAALLVLALVRETRKPGPEEERRGFAANVRELLRVPALRWILVVILFSQCGLMLINPQISLFVQELAGGGDVNRIVGFVIAAPAFSSFIMSPLWGRLGDRRGHAGVLGAALLAAGLIVPWAAAAVGWLHVFLIRFAMGGFTSALNPSTHSVAAHSVDEHRTAGAFSLLSSVQMFGACVGPLLSGPLAVMFGIRALFPVTGLLLVAAGLSAFRVRALQAVK